VSHELRTPLTSIKGFVELLLDGAAGELSTQQRDFLNIILHNAEREVTVVNDLLDLSRLDAGKVDLRLAPLQVASLLRQVVRSLTPALGAKDQLLELQLADELPPLRADPVRLSQVFTNLISNAHKYTPAGGRITVVAESNGATLRVSVADTGIGMTPEEQAFLFTKFFRARNRVTSSVDGTGLGLAITRALVEQHGGSITVVSAPGQGSTFTVELPALVGAATVTASLTRAVGKSPT